nr:hypothetical protein [Tanacetum cinerariifolium]
MTTSNITSSTDIQMHNNIMAVGSRDRLPMLAPGRYPQWCLRFLRYVDTRLNGEALRKCIMSGPYKPTTVLVHDVEATDDSPVVPEHTTVETPTNMSSENKAHFLAEKEVIHLILTGIGDDIYLTVDDCQTAQEMWEAIEMLQQGQRSISSTTSTGMVKFGNQRTVNVVVARENVGSKYDGLANTDEEVDKQELEAHYSYMAKIQEHSEKSKSVSNTCLMETDDSNAIPDSPDMYEDDIQNDQNDVKSDDERIELANLKLDVDENKKIQKKLKKANTTLAQELKECNTILAETSKSLEESISVRDSCLVALQTKQAEFEKYNAFNDRTVDYEKLEHALDELQCLYLHKVKECDCLAQKLSKQTEYVSKKVHTKLLQRFAKVEKHLISLKLALQKCKEQVKNDSVCNEKASNVFRKEREQYFEIQDLKAKLQDKNIAISELKKLIEKVLGKPTPFSNSLDRIYFRKTKSVPKAIVSEGLSKPVTAQTLPQAAKKA